MKKITFTVNYDQILVDKILHLLKKSGKDSYTMLEFSQALGKDYEEGGKGWEKLRFHLIYLAKKGIIEERHFGKNSNDWNRIVDYV